MEHDKHIVITGGSRGIGLAMAEEFLKAGCLVLIAGKAAGNLRRAKQSLKSHAGRIFSSRCDVTKISQVEKLWREAVRRFKTVDVWINNAGVGQDALPVWEVPAGTVEAIVRTNVAGLVYGMQAAFRGMRGQGQGQIYNMEGLGSDGRHMRDLTIYGASKSAVRYLTVGMNREARGSGVLIGSISPGMVVTDFVLGPLRRDPERMKRSLRVLNIIADRPETVARAMVPRILANKKPGARLRWLTGGKILARFMATPFIKRKVFPAAD